MNRSLCILAGLVGLAACHSQTSQTTSTTPDTPGQALTPQATLTSSPGTSYRVFRGLLPGQADSITLHLVMAPHRASDAEIIGSYGSYYGGDGHPYELQGQPSAAADSVVLFDISPERAIGTTTSNLYWRLRKQAGRGDLAGTVDGQPMRLRLVTPNPGALTFVPRYFADSAAAFPQEPKSPVGHISLQALVPVGGAERVRNALDINMLRDLRGDTISDLPTVSLSALYKLQRQQFLKTYREDAADMRPAPADTAGVGTYGIGLSYADQTATYVLCRQANLLSIGFFRYNYSGGAHGNYFTTAVSYDLRTGQRLPYDAIFQPTAAAQLPALLDRAVRPLVGLQANEPLSKQLFVRKMPVTHNVFLAPGGVVFIYQPYEIASFAQGEIRVFLPFSELRPLLREGLPLPGSSSVATR
jgi:hypothetical protein